jgi:hypothetical protein
MTASPVALIAVGLLLIGSTGTAAALDKTEVAQQPTLKAGDSWVFDDSTVVSQTGFIRVRSDVTIDRVDGDTIVLGVKKDGAPTGYGDSIMGADWSRRLLLKGKETITNRPFAFPMNVGKTWSADWDDIRHGNVLSGHSHRSCTATDWEEVSVPGGAFHALKVVCKGLDVTTLEVPAKTFAGMLAAGVDITTVASLEKGGDKTIPYITYSELYYVPRIKNYVKSVEERYTSDNVRLFRTTSVLVSFAPATQ